MLQYRNSIKQLNYIKQKTTKLENENRKIKFFNVFQPFSFMQFSLFFNSFSSS